MMTMFLVYFVKLKQYISQSQANLLTECNKFVQINFYIFLANNYFVITNQRTNFKVMHHNFS